MADPTSDAPLTRWTIDWDSRCLRYTTQDSSRAIYSEDIADVYLPAEVDAARDVERVSATTEILKLQKDVRILEDRLAALRRERDTAIAAQNANATAAVIRDEELGQALRKLGEAQKKLDYAKTDHERCGKALWAAVDVIKAHVGEFDAWPEAFKDAFSWACIAANQELTPADIQRTKELAERLGWEKE